MILFVPSQLPMAQLKNNDLINHNNSMLFWFVILSVMFKTHRLRQENTITLALYQLVFN